MINKSQEKVRPWGNSKIVYDQLSTSPFLDALDLTTLPLKFTGPPSVPLTGEEKIYWLMIFTLR